MTHSARRRLAIIATITVGLAICIAYLDRPVADFVQAHFYGTLVFDIAIGVLAGLRPILLLLALAFLGCAYWIASGRGLPPWGAIIWACATAGMIGVVTAVAFKFLIGRSDVYPAYLARGLYDFRPLHWSPEYGAFPSAAATVTTAIATVLWRQLPRWRALWATVSIVVLAAVLAVNGHWVSDILAGVCAGVFIGGRAAKLAGQRARHERPTR